MLDLRLSNLSMDREKAEGFLCPTGPSLPVTSDSTHGCSLQQHTSFHLLCRALLQGNSLRFPAYCSFHFQENWKPLALPPQSQEQNQGQKDDLGVGSGSMRRTGQACSVSTGSGEPSGVGSPGMVCAKASGDLLSGQRPLEVQREEAQVRPQLEAF